MYRYISDAPFILASTSPRRRELLQSIGLEFSIAIPDCDESLVLGESAEDMVARLSEVKAKSVASKNSKAWVLGADTTVVIDNQILGKPASAEEARSMLQRISGRQHDVWGGLALVNEERQVNIVRSFRTRVLMRKLGPTEISAFIATGEPMDKAGAYAVQERGAGLVSEIEGSYTNVVGLNISGLLDVLGAQKIIEL